MIQFTIYSEPVPKGRPKVGMRGRHPVVYTPEKTRKAERNFLAQAIPYKPDTPLQSNLSIEIKFYHAIPLSKPKKWKAEAREGGQIRPATRPDIDNEAKLVLDALNTVFFADDRQIVELHLEKWYSARPRTEVTIKELNEN